MNNFSKLLLIISISCAAIISANAQANTSVPVKDAILVDYFIKTPEIPLIYLHNIRGQIMDGIQKRGRLVVLDAEQFPQLSPAVFSPQQLPDNYIKGRENSISKTGAKYLLGGIVSNYRFNRKASGKKQSFSSYFTITIWGYNIVTGEKFGQQQFNLSGYGSTMDEADLRAISSIYNRMDYFISSTFKFETRILGICEPTVREDRTRLYISAGTAMGVRITDQFDVYMIETVGGVRVRNKVGKITVREISGDNVSICTMKRKEQEFLINLIRSGKELVAVSAGSSIF